MLRTVLEVLPCCPVSVQRQLVALLPEICLEDDHEVKPLRCDWCLARSLARLHASTMGEWWPAALCSGSSWLMSLWQTLPGGYS